MPQNKIVGDGFLIPKVKTHVAGLRDQGVLKGKWAVDEVRLV